MISSRHGGIGFLLLLVGTAAIAPALLMGGWSCSVERLVIMSAAVTIPPLLGMGLLVWCVDWGALPSSCRESAGLLCYCLMGEVLFELSCRVWILGSSGQSSGLSPLVGALIGESITAICRMAAIIAIAGATATLPCAWFVVAARSRYCGYVAALRMIITALSIFMLLQRYSAFILNRLSLVLS